MTGEVGLSIVTQRFLLEFGWILRRTHQEYDFGIDGHVDIVTARGEVTGRQFAVQVKHGTSYFDGENTTLIPFRGELRHLNYYMNYPVPVIILLVRPGSTEIFWALVDPLKTRRSGEHWILDVPKTQMLTSDVREALEDIAGPSHDYSEELHHYWKENEGLYAAGVVLLGVARDAIEANDVSLFVTMFERLQVSDDLARHLQGKVSVFIHGYDDDPRELWEIPEVRQWIATVQPIVKYWFFFLATEPQPAPLLLFAACSGPVSRIGASEWEFEWSTREQWFYANLRWLNEITKRLGLSLEDNKRITFSGFRCLPGLQDLPESGETSRGAASDALPRAPELQR